MTNFSKTSRFDDGEVPPVKEYDDFDSAQTETLFIKLTAIDPEDNEPYLIKTYEEALAEAIQKRGKVYKSLIPEEEVMQKGYAVFLVPKRVKVR